jgi:hypothetical protein
MMLRHDGKINNVVIGEVLHVMAVPHRTIVALTGMTHLNIAVVVAGEGAADDKHNLAVALVGMQATRSTRAQGGIHNLHAVVNKVACIQFTLATLEALKMSFSNLLKIDNHNIRI